VDDRLSVRPEPREEDGPVLESESLKSRKARPARPRAGEIARGRGDAEKRQAGENGKESPPPRRRRRQDPRRRRRRRLRKALEIEGEVTRRLEAQGRVLLQAVPHDSLEPGRDGAPRFRGLGRL